MASFGTSFSAVAGAGNGGAAGAAGRSRPSKKAGH